MVVAVVQPPSMQAPITDKSGMVTPAWLQFFTALVAPPSAIDPLVVTLSPYEYTASAPGNLLVRGGTVSALALIRARVTIDPLGIVEGFIPMGLGDLVRVTYTVVPDMWFVPN